MADATPQTNKQTTRSFSLMTVLLQKAIKCMRIQAACPNSLDSLERRTRRQAIKINGSRACEKPPAAKILAPLAAFAEDRSAGDVAADYGNGVKPRNAV
jgi:hypothetical protein